MKLNEKHIRAITERARPENFSKSDDDIAQACGMHRTTFWRTMQTSEAQTLLRERREHFTAMTTPRVMGALQRNALAGDTSAIKTYLQVTGDIGSGGATQVVNVTQTNEQAEDSVKRLWADRLVSTADNDG
jgi:hypothetical protein